MAESLNTPSSQSQLSFSQDASSSELPYRLPLELTVEDPETIRALIEHTEGPTREQFALEAMKIGVLALRHAGGRLDADLIHRESRRLVEQLRSLFADHSRQAHDRLTNSLREYFDPEDGRFSERVERLVGPEGELERVMRAELDGEDSQLAKTLLQHFGESSPLMKTLSPTESQGLLMTLRRTVEAELATQRERLLREFSLDEEGSALRRLVTELTENHGELSTALQTKIDGVMKEFSLHEEGSALKRLCDNVDEAQQKIRAEFSLDNEQSALKRLKVELLDILRQQTETSAKFQEEVKVALGQLVAKRGAEARSTARGHTFEQAVLEFLHHDAQGRGDIAEFSGDTTGQIKNCKVGDVVIQLGPESAAPHARIVVEAKEKQGYSLSKARQELDLARKNRGADFGIFVYSQDVAPGDMRPLMRYGNDIVVTWDARDATSDVIFLAALEIARALSVRRHASSPSQTADFASIDESILDIEKRTGNLDEVRKSAETIKSAAERIIDRARIDKKELEKQVQVLRETMQKLER